MALFGVSFFKSGEVKKTLSNNQIETSPSFIQLVDDSSLMPMSDFYRPSEKSKNTNIGQNILNGFNNEYPTLESSTYLATQINYLKRNNGSEEEIKRLEQKLEEVDKRAKELMTRTESNIGKSNSSELFIQNIKELNVANCGDRATLVQQKLDEMNLPNKKVILQSLEPFAEHEFNVIGLDENADISNPTTWGENAVIIDTWAGKVFDINSAQEFYSDFFGLSNFKNVQLVEDNQ